MVLPLLVAAAVAPPAAAAPDRSDPVAIPADEDRWRASLARVSRAVVSIRMDRPRAFEGAGRGNGQATGFVVDAELGLILTNRHVIGAGPVRARAMFHHNEVVDLEPVYRDPVHDFGLFRYDPAALKFDAPPTLALRPEDAAVGVQIRVVGNDSGERLSILDGTLARLDRPAPQYGGAYSDFDTFYIQAASSTSGGSSGSPVVDIDGDVVALNAGSNTATASSFFLPLERVVRAVERVRRGEPVPRGSLLTRMEIEPFDELRRLGLPEDLEREARAARPGGPGMLVVREVVPEGPADGKLEIGDVVVAIDGRPVLDFVTMEAALDDRVGGELAVRVVRDGRTVDVVVPVVDLHAITPSRLLEVGGGVLHDLSLHQARRAGVPLRGVYVADPGRAFQAADVPGGAVIVEAAGRPIRSLRDLEPLLAGAAHGEMVPLRYYALGRPQQIGEAALRVDRKWFPLRTCARDEPRIDEPWGARPPWPCTELGPPPAPDTPRSRPLDVPWAPADDRRARALQRSLVGIRTEVPFPVAGLPGTAYVGAGLVVDAERGLVVVDRDTVPIALGEVRMVVAGAFEVPARIVALHETHDLAVIRYDPADLGPVVLQAAPFTGRPLRAGDEAWFVGLERDGQLEVKKVEVSRVEAFSLPANGAPRFRERNLDVVDLIDRPPSVNGVLADRRGRVAAFWASFSYHDGQRNRATWKAIPAEVVEEAVELAVATLGAGPDAPEGGRFRTLGWELRTVPLPRATERGLPADEAERLVAHDPERRTVLEVVRIATGDPLGEGVRTGDLVLAIDGRPVTRYREVELALHGRPRVTLTVCRGGGIVEAAVATQPLQPIDVDRVVLWAGVRIHAPDRSAQLEGVERGKPYVAWLEAGSPAARAGLQPQRTILAVDGRETPDLDAFLAAIRDAGRSVRLTLRTRQGEREVVTVEPDPAFFGAELLERGPDGWTRRRL